MLQGQPSTDVVWSITYIRTSEDGSVLDSDGIGYSGDRVPRHRHSRERPAISRRHVRGSADYKGGNGYVWQAMAPGGSTVTGQAANGAKQGDLPGGNGIYGAGDVCLFSGYLAG